MYTNNVHFLIREANDCQTVQQAQMQWIKSVNVNFLKSLRTDIHFTKCVAAKRRCHPSEYVARF